MFVSGVGGSPVATTLEAGSVGRTAGGPGFTSPGRVAGEWSCEASLAPTTKRRASGHAAARDHG